MTESMLNMLLSGSISLLTSLSTAIITLRVAKGAEAKGKCLNKLYDLKRLLERLSKNMDGRCQNEQRYYEDLMEIKFVIENLDVENAGLMFKSYDLNEFVLQSLLVFKEFDPKNENLAFHVTQTAVTIVMIWGGVKFNFSSPDFESIVEIQKFIKQSFIWKFVGWVHSQIKQLYSHNKALEKANE